MPVHLVHSPRLIVCDEPTSALDHETGRNVMTLLKDVALHKDRTLVIVTHDARIFDFADRIAEMDDGHIIKVQRYEGERYKANVVYFSAFCLLPLTLDLAL